MFRRKTEEKKPTLDQVKKARKRARQAISSHPNPKELLDVFKEKGFRVNGSFTKVRHE